MMQPSSTNQSKPDPTQDCLLLSGLDCLVEEGCIMLWKCVFWDTLYMLTLEFFVLTSSVQPHTADWITYWKIPLNSSCQGDSNCGASFWIISSQISSQNLHFLSAQLVFVLHHTRTETTVGSPLNTNRCNFGAKKLGHGQSNIAALGYSLQSSAIVSANFFSS